MLELPSHVWLFLLNPRSKQVDTAQSLPNFGQTGVNGVFFINLVCCILYRIKDPVSIIRPSTVLKKNLKKPGRDSEDAELTQMQPETTLNSMSVFLSFPKYHTNQSDFSCNIWWRDRNRFPDLFYFLLRWLYVPCCGSFLLTLHGDNRGVWRRGGGESSGRWSAGSTFSVGCVTWAPTHWA